MADGGRRLFVEIFKNFWQSLKPRQIAGNKIGSDYFGNMYYEIPRGARRGNSRRERWFVPKDKEAFDQEIPAEWEAWLRGRRTDAPTKEELERNLKLIELKKMNYAKLEAQYRLDNPKSVTEQKQIGYETFPKYEEYETSPGQHTNKK